MFIYYSHKKFNLFLKFLVKILFIILCFNCNNFLYAHGRFDKLSDQSLKDNKLIIILDWFANPDHAPLFVAEQEGFFKKRGLEIKLIAPADPSDPTKLVAAGKADIAVTYQPQFTLQVCQGLPLVRIGTLIAQPLDSIAVLSESRIYKISDLQNKIHGYSLSQIDNIILKTIFKSNNLDINLIKNINIHYNLSQGLLSKQVDFISGVMRNFGPIEFELLGKKLRLFYPEDYGVPNYDELILVISKNNINNNKILLFLDALSEAVIYLKKYPEISFKKFAKAHPELNNELNRRVWFATLPLFASNPQTLDKARYQKFTAFLHHEGACPVIPPIDNYVFSFGSKGAVD